MKKVTILLASLVSASILGAPLAHADTTYPAKAISKSTVIMEEDNGEGGETTGPGGGEDGNHGGETIKPPTGGDDGEDGVVDPGQKTSLRLSLLTAFDFGTIKMSGNTETYAANLPKPTFVTGGKKERPNFVQVTDNRGNLAGWNVTAKISQQFTNGTSVLTGSFITLDNGWTEPQAADNAAFAPTVTTGTVKLTEESAPIASAAAGKGMGTWNIMYGTLHAPQQGQLGDARKSVNLTIPGSVQKVAGTYTAKVEWTLANTPAS